MEWQIYGWTKNWRVRDLKRHKNKSRVRNSVARIWKSRGSKWVENKAGYTANISRGRVGRGGNAHFNTFQLDHHDQRTDGRTDKAFYRVACPQLKTKKKKEKNKIAKKNSANDQTDRREDTQQQNHYMAWISVYLSISQMKWKRERKQKAKSLGLGRDWVCRVKSNPNSNGRA